jgi:hypothetical protein
MDAPASEEAPDQAAQYIASLTQELAEIARRKGLSVGERAAGIACRTSCRPSLENHQYRLVVTACIVRLCILKIPTSDGP